MKRQLSRLWLAGVLAIALPTSQCWAQDAERIVKAMSDYLGSAKTIALTFDTDIEVITPDVQKLQFTSSGQVTLSRPDKLRATRVGGYADVELVFDGKALTVLGKNINAFAQVEAPGSIDQLVQRLRDEFSVSLPGADLLLSRSYDELMMGVLDAKYIGRGVVDGVECEHLAFRNEDADWQLWVEVGARPIPRKYVITSKAVAAAPQYTLRIKEFRTDAPQAADAFAFKAPASAKKIAINALSEIDEIPQGTIPGVKK
ncbi:DUF2092 domain-containing protein [Bradyrhizobium sp. Arg62]|uniref:DUF2092 domain-containing protein n=1 Tax=Bradyrhizobium brasilense TaxID=1419277 RepID=UPI001E3B541E|nr:DUF2092 domain-containing protein [Bradyrhizobium brasilense]MCC8943600.1 DUF2092 domain-containing protein [Bradyrhizobium brasilense]